MSTYMMHFITAYESVPNVQMEFGVHWVYLLPFAYMWLFTQGGLPDHPCLLYLYRLCFCMGNQCSTWIHEYPALYISTKGMADGLSYSIWWVILLYLNENVWAFMHLPWQALILKVLSPKWHHLLTSQEGMTVVDPGRPPCKICCPYVKRGH